MVHYRGEPHQNIVYKDAIYFSVHKLVSRTSRPGILIAKKNVFKIPVHHGCGGGAVPFAYKTREIYEKYLLMIDVYRTDIYKK